MYRPPKVRPFDGGIFVTPVIFRWINWQEVYKFGKKYIINYNVFVLKSKSRFDLYDI